MGVSLLLVLQSSQAMERNGIIDFDQEKQRMYDADGYEYNELMPAISVTYGLLGFFETAGIGVDEKLDDAGHFVLNALVGVKDWFLQQ